MKKGLTIIMALVCIAGILLTSACGENTAVAFTADGVDVNAGEYIFAQIKANNNAIAKFEELNPETDTEEEGFDYYKQEIEGKPFRDWVIDNAIEIIAKRRVYEQRFEDLGLSFTPEELAAHKKNASDTWENESSDLAYLGISEKTVGLYYETLGISKQSYQKMVTGDAMAEKVFHALYGEGGEREVPRDELMTEFSRLFFRYRVIAISLTDAEGNTITDETELQKLEDMGNDYVERLKAGESWHSIAKDYDAYLAELDAEEDSEDAEEEETEDENDFDRLLSLEEVEYYDYDLYKRIAEMPHGVPELHTDEYGYYVMMSLDITEREDWLSENEETVIHSLRGEEIDNETAELAKAVEIIRNETAIKRYDPKKTL